MKHLFLLIILIDVTIQRSNKTLYAHVPIRPLPDDYEPSIVYLPGTSLEPEGESWQKIIQKNSFFFKSKKSSYRPDVSTPPESFSKAENQKETFSYCGCAS